VPALANAGPDCDPCGGPLKVIVQREKKGLTVWYIKISYKIIIKSVRELCVVSHCVFLKITNARIPHERGARLRQIGPIGLWPAQVLQTCFLLGIQTVTE
jgi:hypothetical protein